MDGVIGRKFGRSTTTGSVLPHEKDFHLFLPLNRFPSMPKKRDGVMTVRISSEDKEQLLKIADLADLTLSDVVVRATREYVRANPLKGKKAKS